MTEKEIKLRRSGRTTRQVDAAIQQLFLAGDVIVADHSNAFNEHKRIFDLVLARLDREHGLYAGTGLIVSSDENRIKLHDDLR